MDWSQSAIRIRLSNGLNFSRAETTSATLRSLLKHQRPREIFITFGGPQGHGATVLVVIPAIDPEELMAWSKYCRILGAR